MYIDRESCLYVPCTELNAELDDFIRSGRTELSEFQVLPETDEQELVRAWTGSGYDVGYHRRRLEYMGRIVTIRCLKVLNPDSGVGVSLIPWFIVPGRPFPVFAYIYAIWHYHKNGKKSMDEAAAACGKLFGIERFHKSTVSRSIKAMEKTLDMSQMDRALAASGGDVPHWEPQAVRPCGDAVGRVTEILRTCPSADSLENAYREEMKPLPEAINTGTAIERALSGIPSGLSRTVIRPEPRRCASRDTRKRAPRPRTKGRGPVQHRFRFVEYAQREKIRTAFIGNCRHLVLDAAATCHRFLV
jgi:hypothetical protein